MASKWMIYGAYGETGRLIVEHAIRAQHRPILAGRDATRLRALAEKYNLEWRAFDIDRAPGSMSGVSLVLNLAGPFLNTGEALIRACLGAKAHYLDISNELPAYQTLRRYDAQARQQGIALIPGVGFGVVPSDMLSQYVTQSLPNPVALHIAMLAENGRNTSGAIRTTLDVIRRGGWVRREAKLAPARLGSHLRKVRFPEGERSLILAPLGDLETSYWSTGVPNITTYIQASAQVAPVMAIVMPVLRQLIRIPMIRRRLEGKGPSPSGSPEVPDRGSGAGATKPSYVWVSAIDATGKQVEAWLQMGNGLAFTAAASLLAVEQTLQTRPSGALSPAMAFGVDFVLRIPGVTRLDSV